MVIALSHGGVEKGTDGRYTDGEDVRLAKDVPGIDVVISGHSHTELHEAIIVNGRTPVVQTGKEGENLGELVITLDGDKLTVDSYRLHPDRRHHRRRPGHRRRDRTSSRRSVTAAVFASRGYSVDQPLAIAPRDLPNTYTDIAAGTLLANLVTDAFRQRHEGRHRLHRQRHDARRPVPREDRRADGLRRVRRGAARRRRGRSDRRAARW